MLRSTPQLIDVRCFKYLKYLQNSAVGTLFESSVKSLIRQTFGIIIGAFSIDLGTPPENRTGYARAGSTLGALLDVWGKDGLEDPESSTVCLRPTSKPDFSQIPPQLLRSFMEERLPQVVHCGPSLVSTYLGLLPEQPGNTYWHQVLDIVASFATREALDWLDRFCGTNPPRYLLPSQGFEKFVKETITTVLENDTSHLKQALSLLERSGSYFWGSLRSLADLHTRLSCDQNFPPIPLPFSFRIICTCRPGGFTRPFRSVGSDRKAAHLL